MNMKKKGVSILMILAMLGLLLAGCSDRGTDQGRTDSVTITIMGRKSDLAKSYMTSIFEQYEKATGNKIEPIPYEDAQFEATAAEDFENGNVPDIFMHFHNADLYRFDIEDNFLYLNDQAWVDDLTDGTREYCTDENGNLMGLPYWENSVSGCYYNKTILDDLGLRPATTQAEFDALCQVLEDSGYTPICWPAKDSAWMVQFALDPIFADNPEKLQQINHNEITYADIPEITDMVKWIDQAAKKGWFGSDYFRNGINEISSVMSSGQAVMTFIWDTWFYTDLGEDGKYTVDDFALMPTFLGTANNGTYEGGNLNMMMVNKNGEHVEECLDFLSFCAKAENYNVAFDGISTVNCFKGQTTNIQSPMVADAAQSIEEYLRASTAASKVVGYSNDDVVPALDSLFRGKANVADCIRMMDEGRIKRARAQGAEGF